MHAPQWVAIALIAVTLVCAGILGWLIYGTALDKDTAVSWKFFLFLVGALAALSAVAVSWDPGASPPRQRLISPFGAGLVMTAVFAAFGTMTSALSLLTPAATKHDTDKIGRKFDELSIWLHNQFPSDPPILSAIAGRWGEQEPLCGLVWDISLRRVGDKTALIAEIVKKPPTVEPFRLVAEVTAARGDTLHVVGEEPAQARGRAATFTVNGATRRLVWDDRQSVAGVEEYQPCPA